MKTLLLTTSLLFSMVAHAQQYLQSNEELIFSFDTQKGKHIVLAKDKQNGYIIYRFGAADKIEFEFPDKTKDSWSKLTYSFYLRGGGKSNLGMELNHINFINGGFNYVIYDEYYSESNEHLVGIKVTDPKTKKTTNIKGIYKTKKGTLADFRENKLLKIVEDENM